MEMETATDRPVVDLKNIGPITARHLHTIGVMSEAELRRLGPVAVYRDRSPEEIRDISVVRLVDGVWTEPAPVHADNWMIEGCPVNGPATFITVKSPCGNGELAQDYNLRPEAKEIEALYPGKTSS